MGALSAAAAVVVAAAGFWMLSPLGASPAREASSTTDTGTFAPPAVVTDEPAEQDPADTTPVETVVTDDTNDGGPGNPGAGAEKAPNPNKGPGNNSGNQDQPPANGKKK